MPNVQLPPKESNLFKRILVSGQWLRRPPLAAPGPARRAVWRRWRLRGWARPPWVLCLCANPHGPTPASQGPPPRSPPSLRGRSFQNLPAAVTLGLGAPAGSGPCPLRRLAAGLATSSPRSTPVTFASIPASRCSFTALRGIYCTAHLDTFESGSDPVMGWDPIYTGYGKLKPRRLILPLVESLPIFGVSY